MRKDLYKKAMGVMALLCMLLLTPAGGMTEQAQAATRWSKLKDKYRHKKTDRLIFVKYKGGTRCRVAMYRKVKKSSGVIKWKKVTACNGYVGKNGLGKQIEGDKKTPVGTFKITKAFGINKDPGSAIGYTRLNKYLYWSGEQGTYNQMVDSRKLGHVPVNSEHLIDYDPHYRYVLAIGYNKKNVYGKGSAIFLHCLGSNPYTGGCVAVPQKNMKKMIQYVTKRTRICIYKE